MRWTPDGKRKTGRSKETWRTIVESELKELGMIWQVAEKKVKTELWRSLVSALCAPTQEED